MYNECTIPHKWNGYKKTVLEELGGFDTNFVTGEDLDMWFRIAHHYPKIGFLWPPTVVYELRRDSVTRVFNKQLTKVVCQLFQKHWTIVESLDEESRVLFEPMGKRLAGWAFRTACNTRDVESFQAILSKPISYFGYQNFFLCSLGFHLPFLGFYKKTRDLLSGLKKTLL